jgi:hypothetical protein
VDGSVVSSIMATARPDLDACWSCARVSPSDLVVVVHHHRHLMLDAPRTSACRHTPSTAPRGSTD